MWESRNVWHYGKKRASRLANFVVRFQFFFYDLFLYSLREREFLKFFRSSLSNTLSWTYDAYRIFPRALFHHIFPLNLFDKKFNYEQIFLNIEKYFWQSFGQRKKSWKNNYFSVSIFLYFPLSRFRWNGKNAAIVVIVVIERRIAEYECGVCERRKVRRPDRRLHYFIDRPVTKSGVG